MQYKYYRRIQQIRRTVINLKKHHVQTVNKKKVLPLLLVVRTFFSTKELKSMRTINGMTVNRQPFISFVLLIIINCRTVFLTITLIGPGNSNDLIALHN